jgi:hypothetical protein
LSKLEVFDDIGEAEPAKRVATVEKLVGCQHLLEAKRTVSVIFLNFNLINLLFNIVERVNVSHDFDFSETELDLVSQEKLFLVLGVEVTDLLFFLYEHLLDFL